MSRTIEGQDHHLRLHESGQTWNGRGAWYHSCSKVSAHLEVVYKSSILTLTPRISFTEGALESRCWQTVLGEWNLAIEPDSIY
jgi:hypothetical protein